MNKNYVFLSLLSAFFISSSLQAQTTNFEWAKKLGSTGNDRGRAITTDADGNVYAVGGFSETVDFDPGPGTTNLTAFNNADVYIQKTDVMGNLIWVKSIGGNADDFGRTITYDGNGNIYIAGYFQGTVDFDPGSGTSNLTALGSASNIFVQKMNTNGNFIWAKSVSGTSDGIPLFVTTDVNGNVYTTGEFKGTADFDPGTDIANLTSNGAEDIFIQKLDTNGNFLWAKSMGSGIDSGFGIDQGFGITTDPNGNVYTVGQFNGIVDFDPGLGTTSLTSNGFADIFIQKLDSGGNFIWGKQIGGESGDAATSITSDVFGNIYVSGSFSETVDFDTGLGISSLISTGSSDMFLLKIDSSGNLIWVKQMGGTDFDQPFSLYLDDMGGLYSTGRFSSIAADFDPGPGITNLTSAGKWDIFIHKMDTSGAFHWAVSTGGTENEYGGCITTDIYGNVYTTGYFSGTVDFEPGPGTTNLSSESGSDDIFIHKMSQCLLSSTTDVITACDSFTWIDGITYTASNNTAIDTIMNATGCDSVVTLDLTIYSVSNITTSLDGTTITANNTSATYAWLDCDNNNSPIPGENNQSFTPTSNGNYAVELKENGCIDTSACVVVTTVGMTESSLTDFLSLHPNPTNGFFSINFGSVQKSMRVKVLSFSGQVLSSHQFQNANSIELELNEPTGIYILEITDEQMNRSVLKLMKE